MLPLTAVKIDHDHRKKFVIKFVSMLYTYS
jgi:hypothetical protein